MIACCARLRSASARPRRARSSEINEAGLFGRLGIVNPRFPIPAKLNPWSAPLVHRSVPELLSGVSSSGKNPGPAVRQERADGALRWVSPQTGRGGKTAAESSISAFCRFGRTLALAGFSSAFEHHRAPGSTTASGKPARRADLHAVRSVRGPVAHFVQENHVALPFFAPRRWRFPLRLLARSASPVAISW